jgi:hypothetical protein
MFLMGSTWLYLTLVAEELRLFGDYDRMADFIAQLPSDVPGMFHTVLGRFEGDHGRELVEHSLALLAIGRHGLLESELLDLLARPGEERFPMAPFFPTPCVPATPNWPATSGARAIQRPTTPGKAATRGAFPNWSTIKSVVNSGTAWRGRSRPSHFWKPTSLLAEGLTWPTCSPQIWSRCLRTARNIASCVCWTRPCVATSISSPGTPWITHRVCFNVSGILPGGTTAPKRPGTMSSRRECGTRRTHRGCGRRIRTSAHCWGGGERRRATPRPISPGCARYVRRHSRWVRVNEPSCAGTTVRL